MYYIIALSYNTLICHFGFVYIKRKNKYVFYCGGNNLTDEIINDIVERRGNYRYFVFE